MKIVLASVGRRNYLLDWFRTALTAEGIRGELVTTEADPTSAGATAGDRYLKAPPYHHPEYADFMQLLFSSEEPDLFISVNDHEIDTLSRLFDCGRVTPSGAHTIPPRRAQEALSDKYRFYTELEAAQIRTPLTVLGSDAAHLLERLPSQEAFIIKDRYGSGSSGLRTVGRGDLISTIDSHFRRFDALQHGCDAVERTTSVIVQPRLQGPEYGVDGVFDIYSPGVLHGVTARRKLRMRSGETDQAITVADAQFKDVIGRLGDIFRLTGLADTDFMADRNGDLHLIDLNPRFGGGYPFNHAAGADAPRYIVRMVLRREARNELLHYPIGVSAAKYEQVRVTGPAHG